MELHEGRYGVVMNKVHVLICVRRMQEEWKGEDEV